MKFSLPDRKNPNKKLYFLRTLKTEKDFKDRYDVEFNAQLGTILAIMMNVEKDTSAKNIEAMTDLKFVDTRNKLVEYLYAKKNDEGVLYQNRETVEEAAGKIENGEINCNQVLVSLLKSI